MTELLPCSKCRRVPQVLPWGTLRDIWCARCELMVTNKPESEAVATWNRLYGAPLTLAERPQDVPACRADAACAERGRACIESVEVCR
jgi:hypothetical protein